MTHSSVLYMTGLHAILFITVLFGGILSKFFPKLQMLHSNPAYKVKCWIWAVGLWRLPQKRIANFLNGQ